MQFLITNRLLARNATNLKYNFKHYKSFQIKTRNLTKGMTPLNSERNKDYFMMKNIQILRKEFMNYLIKLMQILIKQKNRITITTKTKQQMTMNKLIY